MVRPDLDVAATLECERELLPVLPEILQDFDSLGSDPHGLIELLESNVPAGELRSALDLCCGKGATAVALARRFGMRVEGVDALSPFVEAARAAAVASGVGDRCRFRVGDLAAEVQREGDYDLVVFSAVGPILGGITETMRHLTKPLRGRGWLAIEDSILLPDAPVRAGFEGHAGLAETRRRIEAGGVTIVASRLAELEAPPAAGDEEHARITRRARVVAERRPELTAAIERYLKRQLEERNYLARWTRDVAWLLRGQG